MAQWQLVSCALSQCSAHPRCLDCDGDKPDVCRNCTFIRDDVSENYNALSPERWVETRRAHQAVGLMIRAGNGLSALHPPPCTQPDEIIPYYVDANMC